MPNEISPVKIVNELGGLISPALLRQGPLEFISRDCVICGPNIDCICDSIEFGSAEYFVRLDRIHNRKRNA